MIEKITNHGEIALSRLITQYKEKPNIENFILAFTNQVQDLEDVIFQLLEERSLDTALGVQLDNLGDILNTRRNGLSDFAYRALLYAKVAQYNSEATTEDIISIIGVLTDSNPITIEDVYPAAFQITLSTGFSSIVTIDELKEIIRQAKPSGVELSSIVEPSDDSFGFFSDPTALEFSDLSAPLTGGTFATLI